MRAQRRATLLAAVATAVLQAACTSVPTVPPASSAAAGSGPRSEEPQPGRSTTADVLALWGEPLGRTVFEQGHQVWHYYHPRNGWALSSRVPGVHLSSTERGRRALEHVLLFDAQGVLVQTLSRELP